VNETRRPSAAGPVTARTDALQSIILSSHRMARTVARELGNETPSAQWRVLATIGEEGPMRIGALAAACRVSQPGMSRLVATMAETGLLARSSDEADERASIVRATTAGEAALRRWTDELGEAVASRFDDLDDADWAAVERVAVLIRERIPGVLSRTSR